MIIFLFADTEILSVLNTGSIKELKKLQGVGEKRARLIADWRTVHGPFEQVIYTVNDPQDQHFPIFCAKKEANIAFYKVLLLPMSCQVELSSFAVSSPGVAPWLSAVRVELWD